MTIAIGIISKQPPSRLSKDRAHIVIASDSQSTYSGTKRRNQKLAEIHFKNGSALIAQAGSVEYGDKVLEIMEGKAAGIALDRPETAADVALDSFRELRNHLIEWHRLSNDQQRFFIENPLELMVGCFFQDKPYLYKMNLEQGVATRIKHYDAIGGGAPLGHLLLTEYARVDPDFQFDEVIAASVIGKVIEHTDGCDHPAWIGGASPGWGKEESTTFIYPQCISENIVHQINAEELKLLDHRREKIQKALENVWGWMADEEQVEAFRDRLGLKKKRNKSPA